MPRDPNGVMTLPASTWVQTGDTVLPVQHNSPFLDIENALTNSIDRDGRTVMTGPLRMGGNKVTNVAPGTNDSDALNVLQLRDRVDAVADFATVADMLADNNQRIGYAGSGARVIVTEGQIITAQGFRYEVAASGATEFDEETAGGVKLILVSKPVDSVTQQLSEREKQQARENIGAISLDGSELAGDAEAQEAFRANINAAPLKGPKIGDFAFEWIAHRAAPMYNPEETLASFSDCVSRGFPFLEMDARLSADGNVILIHNATVNEQTNGTGSVASKTTAELKALGVLGFGSGLGDGQPLATLSEACAAFRDAGIFVVEGKVSGAIPKIMTTFQAYGIPKDQAVISDFTLSHLAPAVKEGYITEALKGSTSDLGEAQTFVLDVISAGVDRIGANQGSSDAVITEYVGSGLPVIAYAINRRHDRDRVVGLGVSGIYTDDPVYVSANEPLFIEDQFHLQTWLPGMLAARDSRAAEWRGQFFGGDGWGWPTVVNTGTGGQSNRWVLQGWACPVVERPENETFSLEFTAEIPDATSDQRWFGLFLADEAYADREVFNDLLVSTLDEKGYLFMARRSGSMEIFRADGGGNELLGTAASPLIGDNNPAHFRITISPTTLTLSRLDGPSGNVTHTLNSSDTTYRGAYFHLGVDRAAAKFSKVRVLTE